MSLGSYPPLCLPAMSIGGHQFLVKDIRICCLAVVWGNQKPEEGMAALALNNMDFEGKKKEGNAARYVTRSQAIKILQVSLSDFRHKDTKELVAMKYIKRGHKIDENVATEIINHRSLRHPNIIRFKEVVLTPTHLAIVMEYAAGGELLIGFAVLVDSVKLRLDIFFSS